jgi:aryl-alcohol dehydrogenase-like predicted oxidoreductase
MEIKTKALGKTGLEISVIGFGAWAIGGQWDYGWGPQDDKDSLSTIRAALERGVNWIDTAPAYGLGHSEELIGRLLKTLSGSEKPFIFTKCGLPWKDGAWAAYNDISPSSINREIDMSLKRLGIDVIELYQIHWPVPDNELEEAWETMANLKKIGKVRHIGASNFSLSQLNRTDAIAPVETLQPNYSLIARDIEEEILPWCASRETGVLCYSPMGSGMLSGKMTRERIAALPEDDWRKSKSEMLREPQLSRNLALVEVLAEIGKKYERSPGEIAIAWVLTNPAVSGAITGMRHPGQTAITSAAEVVLDGDDMDRIDRFFEVNPKI